MNYKVKLLIFIAILNCLTTNAFSGTQYVSQIDKELSIKKVFFPSAYDNIKGIFSKPLTEYLSAKIEEDKIWDSVNCTVVEGYKIDELMDNPTLVSKNLKSCGADGLLVLNILKGPQGSQLKLGLFTSSGQIFSLKDKYVNENQTLNSLKNEVQNLYKAIHDDFPFQGLVLSRTGNKLSISRGLDIGVELDSEYSIVQVINIERHPKYNFIVNSQKEIIGKIHITKVEETMSFGYLVFEKEPNVVEKNMKVVLLNPKEYNNLANSKNEDVIEHLSGRKDSELMLGKNSDEWTPAHKPTFGKLSFDFGVGSYLTNSNLATSGGVSGKAPLSLSMNMLSEIWITPKYFVQLDYSQGSATFKNELSNSAPSNLNASLVKYDLFFGMNFLMEGENYFGPKVQAMIGLSNFQSSVDESSPVAFTSMVYSGLGIGVRGVLPWSEESPLSFGAETYYSLMPSTGEAPVTSGNVDKTSVLSFSAFGQYKIKENINLITKIISDSYSTTFSGSGTRVEASSNTSHSWTKLAAGIEYFF